MPELLALIAVVASLLLGPCLIKLAARILRRIAVSWQDCFLFSLLLTALYMIPSMAGMSWPKGLPHSVTGTITFALILFLSTWYFSTRASTAQGVLLGWRGALRLSLVAGGLALATTLVLAAITLLGLVQVFRHL
ncbi:hypothetical protein [Janthinobacterium agaricidamnosum]|uniref:Putative membrane protein n=1 Tax=Janthinobacterium agaricidamnosum NBRC 102515 = DSM 9628 TaxID=1349767 RepID=W0VCI5_9BURK|nr:hypothetical protein [Janthinobacterium agaricidamnosum]CDG85380.1 putative membrane protein [Janthinobacterium agaricidamnosum NBRC 102515 = DSM 9628]